MMVVMVRFYVCESSGVLFYLFGVEYGYVIGRWINGG